MIKRLSAVGEIYVNTIAFSSQLQIGDSSEISSRSRTIAVQREAEYFYGNEGSYQAYSLFSMPVSLPPINEKVIGITDSLNNTISVGKLEVFGTTTASIIHIGSTRRVYGENRRKHIRQLNERDENDI